MNVQNLGQKIKNCAKRKNISPEKLAKDAGIAKTTLYNYFNNSTKIEVQTLEVISKVLEVPITYWFHDSDINYIETSEAKEQEVKYNNSDLTWAELDYLKKEIELKNEIIELQKKLLENKK